MNRRGFLQTCIALGAAPYVITGAGVLMPVQKVLSAPIDLWPGINAWYDNMFYRWVGPEAAKKLQSAGWEIVSLGESPSIPGMPVLTAVSTENKETP